MDRFLHGKLVISSKWYEKDNIIYISVPLVNDGKTFDQWNAYLKEKDKETNYYGLKVSMSERNEDGNYGYDRFVEGLTPRIAIAKIAIMRNGIIKDGEQKTINNFRMEGEKRGLTDINPWFMYCLAEILDGADFKEWGFEYIEGVHKPLEGVDGEPTGLRISSYSYGRISLSCAKGDLDIPRTYCGFAFEVKDRNWYSAYEENEVW